MMAALVVVAVLAALSIHVCSRLITGGRWR